MTSTTIAAPDRADLRSLSATVGQMEAVISETAAVLDAIFGGGLLDAAPPGREDAQLHNTACLLLDLLRSRVRQIEELPGTDPSVSLSLIAEARS